MSGWPFGTTAARASVHYIDNGELIRQREQLCEALRDSNFLLSSLALTKLDDVAKRKAGHLVDRNLALLKRVRGK